MFFSHLTLLSRQKTFEYRRDDRGYKPGDWLVICEYNNDHTYTGRFVTSRIGYILRGYGLPDGYCILSLLDTEVATA